MQSKTACQEDLYHHSHLCLFTETKRLQFQYDLSALNLKLIDVISSLAKEVCKIYFKNPAVFIPI